MVTIQAPRVIDVGTLRTLSWGLPNVFAHAAFVRVLEEELGDALFTMRDRVRRDQSVFVELSFDPVHSETVFFAVYHTQRLMKDVARVAGTEA